MPINNAAVARSGASPWRPTSPDAQVVGDVWATADLGAPYHQLKQVVADHLGPRPGITHRAASLLTRLSGRAFHAGEIESLGADARIDARLAPVATTVVATVRAVIAADAAADRMASLSVGAPRPPTTATPHLVPPLPPAPKQPSVCALDKNLCCPISGEPFVDPVLCGDGEVRERNVTQPQDVVAPCYTVKSLVHLWQTAAHQGRQEVGDIIARALECPITYQIMLDPVTASDGSTYECAAIAQHFHINQHTSPLTNAPLANGDLYRNATIRRLTQNLLQDRRFGVPPLTEAQRLLMVAASQQPINAVVDPEGIGLHLDTYFATTANVAEAYQTLAEMERLRIQTPDNLHLNHAFRVRANDLLATTAGDLVLNTGSLTPAATDTVPCSALLIRADVYRQLGLYREARDLFSLAHRAGADRSKSVGPWLLCCERMGDDEEMGEVFALLTEEEIEQSGLALTALGYCQLSIGLVMTARKTFADALCLYENLEAVEGLRAANARPVYW